MLSARRRGCRANLLVDLDVFSIIIASLKFKLKKTVIFIRNARYARVLTRRSESDLFLLI